MGHHNEDTSAEMMEQCSGCIKMLGFVSQPTTIIKMACMHRDQESKIKSDQGLLNVSAIQFRPAGLYGQFISVKLAEQRMDVLHSLSYHHLGN